MRFNIHSAKGSTTVEASIIMPVVILLIIALLFLPVYLYRQVYLQCAINQAAERAYVIWRNINGDIETGNIQVDEINSDELYKRIYDPLREKRIEAVRDFIENRLSIISYDIGKGQEDLEVDISFRNSIFFHDLEIAVKKPAACFAGNRLRLFDVGEFYSLNASTAAAIYDPAEFIRNVDLTLEIKNELEEKYPGLQNLGDRLREIFKGLSEWPGNE